MSLYVYLMEIDVSYLLYVCSLDLSENRTIIKDLTTQAYQIKEGTTDLFVLFLLNGGYTCLFKR